MNNVMAEKRGVALSPNNLSFRPLFHRDRAARGQGVGVLSVTACPDQEGGPLSMPPSSQPLTPQLHGEELTSCLPETS